LENTGRQGYIEGISSIILKHLNNLEQYQRPIHCSDYKREVIYIKDNDKWEKECDEKPILTKAIKVIANEKVKETIEFVQNIIDQGKKVIIFTNFTDTLQLIHNHFGKESVYLDGSCNKVQRQYAVDQFQENEKVKVFVGNLKAAGVGLTLTAAEVVIMNDLSFVPAEHAQAEDRAYRYGQKNNVLVYYPIFENTIEVVIYDILNKKKKIIGTVMGDEVQDSGDVVEEILKLINKRP
jgi:SWI/SNF-related matrix-associated actin-dependent regulator 1 of chromatin subfamily A